MSLSARETTFPTNGAETVTWDLSDLYPSLDDGAFHTDLERIADDTRSFAATWKGTLASCSDDQFLMMLQHLEHIHSIMGRLHARVQLEWTTRSNDENLTATLQRVQEELVQARKQLVFVAIELRSMPEDAFQRLVNSPLLGRYRHWLEFNRSFRPHTLSEAEEQLEAEMDLVGIDAWIQLFEQTHARMRYRFERRDVPQQTIMQALQDASRERRKSAAHALSRGLERQAPLLAYILNMMLTDAMLSQQRRKYEHWLSFRNKANKVSDEAVQALVATVTEAYPLVHRYYDLKRRIIGLEDFFEWDRNAPIIAHRDPIAWQKACELVVRSFHAFHPQIGTIAEEFFTRRWIDAAIRPGKQAGAYAAPTVPEVHPYVFLNYTGTARDVKTLAHELGHGVHQYLARKQGVLNASTPLTIAETASVFGEMLVFDTMLRQATTDHERLVLLMDKLNDIINTVFRQIALNRFEDAIHTYRRHQGMLTVETFNQLWMQTQQPMYGQSVTLTSAYRWWWSYIPHFVHTPGYVYAYAFGELLVLALFELYRTGSLSDFEQRYIELLEAGGSEAPQQLLGRLFGLDLEDATFWQQGIRSIEELLEHAEQLAQHVSTVSSN